MFMLSSHARQTSSGARSISTAQPRYECQSADTQIAHKRHLGLTQVGSRQIAPKHGNLGPQMYLTGGVSAAVLLVMQGGLKCLQTVGWCTQMRPVPDL